MSLKVLVTGGSGYLGTRLITGLLRDGREVRATVRALDGEAGVREAVRHGGADDTGLELVEVTIPDWPYDSLNLILFAEGAAAFEDLTLSGGLRELKEQVPDAWPNLFRQARFLSAVDFVQADRMRRKVAGEMARVFSEIAASSRSGCSV